MAVSEDDDKAYITVHNVGLVIVDISDTLNIVEIGSCEIEGNIFDVALSKDGTKAYVVNNTHPKSIRKSHLITIDISDQSNPIKICEKHLDRKNGNSIKLSKDGKRAFISCGEYLEVVDIKQRRLNENIRNYNVYCYWSNSLYVAFCIAINADRKS